MFPLFSSSLLAHPRLLRSSVAPRLALHSPLAQVPSGGSCLPVASPGWVSVSPQATGTSFVNLHLQTSAHPALRDWSLLFSPAPPVFFVGLDPMRPRPPSLRGVVPSPLGRTPWLAQGPPRPTFQAPGSLSFLPVSSGAPHLPQSLPPPGLTSWPRPHNLHPTCPFLLSPFLLNTQNRSQD